MWWGGTEATQCPVGNTGCPLRGATQHQSGHNTGGCFGWVLPFILVQGTDMHSDSFKKCHAITNSVFEKSTNSKLYLKLPYFASILFYSISGIACLLFILLFIWRCSNSRTGTPLTSYEYIYVCLFKNLILNNIHVSVRLRFILYIKTVPHMLYMTYPLWGWSYSMKYNCCTNL